MLWIAAGISRLLDGAVRISAHVSAGLIVALAILSVVPPAAYLASNAAGPAGVSLGKVSEIAVYLLIILMFYAAIIKVLTGRSRRRAGRIHGLSSVWSGWGEYSPWRFVSAIAMLIIANAVKHSLLSDGYAALPEVAGIDNGLTMLASIALFIGMTAAFIRSALSHASKTPIPSKEVRAPPTPKQSPPPTTHGGGINKGVSRGVGVRSSWRGIVDSFIKKPIPALKDWPRVRRVSGPYVVNEELLKSFKGVEGVDRVKCWLIGCGGWGCVYECVSGSGWRAALKIHRSFRGVIEGSEVLAEVPTAPESVIRRIKSEVDALRSVRHSNLVMLNGYSLLIPAVMYEFVEGGSLRGGLNRFRGDLRSVLILGIQVGDAIRYLHSRGLIHRDLKPSNVLVAGEGYVKVGDYSSVRRLLEASTSTAGTLCTPGYCAPEQVFSDLAAKSCEAGMENRVDVYQLGNLILESLTGEVIDGEEAVKRSERISEVLKGVGDRDLRSLLREMLSPDPLSRPSAEEVVKELARIIG